MKRRPGGTNVGLCGWLGYEYGVSNMENTVSSAQKKKQTTTAIEC